VAEFTALRQEVNLQTRAARSQLEQNAEAMRQLEEASSAQEKARAEAGGADRDEILRPLIKTLLEVYDAMALARREVERTQKTLDQLHAQVAISHAPPPDKQRLVLPQVPRRRWWHWRQSRAKDAVPVLTVADMKTRLARQELELAALREAASGGAEGERARQVLSSVLVGYTMGLQRLERALAQHNLEPIECIGRPFDPECMEVVDVVIEPGRQSTEVLEEVRRGYRWQGRLFRPAQVRVAKGS
jgi:molecular chaperone GrpE